MTLYHIKNGGNDSLAGTTPATAWETLDKARAHQAASGAEGDEYALAGGSAWYGEQLKNGRSGIRWRAYNPSPGSRMTPPIVSGALDLATGDWTDQGSNVWTATITGVTAALAHLFFGGIHGLLQATAGAVNAAYEWHFATGTSVLTVYSVGNPTTIYGTMRLVILDQVWDLNDKDDCSCDGIDLRDWGAGGTFPGAVYAAAGTAPERCKLNRCHVDNGALAALYPAVRNIGGLLLEVNHCDIIRVKNVIDNLAGTSLAAGNKIAGIAGYAFTTTTGTITYRRNRGFGIAAVSAAAAGSSVVDGGDNVFTEDPKVRRHNRIAANVLMSLSVDDLGEYPGSQRFLEEALEAIRVREGRDRARYPLGIGVTPAGLAASEVTAALIRKFRDLGAEILNHSWSHQPYAASGAALQVRHLTESVGATTATLTIAANALTTSIDSATDLNLDLTNALQDTWLELAAKINAHTSGLALQYVGTGNVSAASAQVIAPYLDENEDRVDGSFIARVVGTELTSWSGPDGNGEYYAACASEPDTCEVDGVEWTKGTVGSLAADEWGWDAGSGGRLYMGTNPATLEVVVNDDHGVTVAIEADTSLGDIVTALEAVTGSVWTVTYRAGSAAAHLADWLAEAAHADVMTASTAIETKPTYVAELLEVETHPYGHSKSLAAVSAQDIADTDLELSVDDTVLMPLEVKTCHDWLVAAGVTPGTVYVYPFGTYDAAMPAILENATNGAYEGARLALLGGGTNLSIGANPFKIACQFLSETTCPDPETTKKVVGNVAFLAQILGLNVCFYTHPYNWSSGEQLGWVLDAIREWGTYATLEEISDYIRAQTALTANRAYAVAGSSIVEPNLELARLSPLRGQGVILGAGPFRDIHDEVLDQFSPPDIGARAYHEWNLLKGVEEIAVGLKPKLIGSTSASVATGNSGTLTIAPEQIYRLHLDPDGLPSVQPVVVVQVAPGASSGMTITSAILEVIPVWESDEDLSPEIGRASCRERV